MYSGGAAGTVKNLEHEPAWLQDHYGAYGFSSDGELLAWFARSAPPYGTWTLCANIPELVANDSSPSS